MSTLPAVELDDALLSRQPDPMQVQAGAETLRWENVESAPQWVSGIRPQFDHHQRLHFVALRPGTETKFRIPPRGAIRVLSLDGRIDRHQLDLLISNGSGLYRPMPLAVECENKSLVAIPDEREVTLARIVAHIDAPVMRLAIFTSRHLPIDFVPGYECPIRQAGEAIRVADDKSGPRSSRRFWTVRPTQPGQCLVKGPARLRFESRFVYATEDRDSLQTYRIHVGLNGILYRTLELETTAEAQRHVHVGPIRNRREVAVGRRQFGYVNIPQGEHELTIDSTANILCRVDSFSPANYANSVQNSLLSVPPSLNDPLNAENAKSIWDLSLENIEYQFRLAPQSAAGQLRLAQRSARDNRFRDGGLRAAMLMRTVSAGRPGDDDIRTAAYDLKVFHTFYRPLLPQSGAYPSDPFVARFCVRSIRPPTDDTIDRVIGEQLLEGVANRAALGRFVTVGCSQQSARNFSLPESSGATLLRVAVDKSSLAPTRSDSFVDRNRRAPHAARCVSRSRTSGRRVHAIGRGNGTIGCEMEARQIRFEHLRWSAHLEEVAGSRNRRCQLRNLSAGRIEKDSIVESDIGR